MTNIVVEPSARTFRARSKCADLVLKVPIRIADDGQETSSQFLSSDFRTLTVSQRSGNFEESSKDLCSSTIFSKGSRTSSTGRRSSFTIDQLRFSELKLHGRAKEQETLLTCLRNVSGTPSDSQESESSSIKQLVFVSGVSGSGKTRFTTATLMQLIRQTNCISAMGKYDLQRRSEPYLGLSSACEKVFMAIATPATSATPAESLNKLDSFRKDLMNDLGDGINTLMQIVPSIKKYIFKDFDQAGFESESETESEEFGRGGNLHEAKAKLNFVFRMLFQDICKHYGPVVVALDDFQWADAASLGLIEELLTCRDIRNLMFIALYRSESMDEAFLVSKTIHELKEKSSEGMFALTEITIGNIDAEGVNGIITDLLSVDSSSATRGLAELCLRRTSGNVFFVLSFLRMLKESEFLEYNFGAMQWRWDVSRIESETVSTTNVVVLTQSKMNTLKQEYQTMLVLASCLGHIFEKQKLIFVADGKLSDSEDVDQIVDEFLTCALEDGFLEGPLGGELLQYRWTHDSIQEAALSLLPDDALDEFKYDVGKSLLKELERKELEKYIFVVVELLNPHAIRVGGLKDSEKEILASLNLSAAKRSSKFSAFASTSKFAKVGIAILSEGHWQTHSQLSLSLFSIAAEAEGSQMHEDEMKKYGSEVLKQDHIPLFDKMRIYRAYLSFLGLGQQGRAKEAVELCLDVLGQLGCHFPRTEFMRTMKLISHLMKHKRELPKRTAEEVAGLPILTSRRLREIDSILNELGIHAYVAGRTILSGLCTMKQTSMTLKHGIHDAAHEGFSSLAPFFMVAFGDLEATDRVAHYATLLKERVHGSRSVSGFCMMQGSFSLPWTHPWSVTLKALLEGYECGMRDGELRNAIYCISSYLCVELFSGVRLATLRHNIDIYLRHTTELNTGYPLTFILMLQGATELLLDNDSSATSSATDHVLVNAYEPTVKDDDYMMAMLYVFQGSVYHAWGDYDRGLVLALKTGILSDKLLSHSANMPCIFYQGFAFYASAQKSSQIMERRRLKRQGMKRHDILKGWVKGGCCNVAHYVAMLDAELAVLNGTKKAVVEELYQKTIVLAARGGWVQDAATANERLALYFRDQGDTVDAGWRFEQAIGYYEDWGFRAKAALLRKENMDSIERWSSSRRVSSS